MTKYVFIASNFVFTKLSSFFVNYEFKSRMNFELIKINNIVRKKNFITKNDKYSYQYKKNIIIREKTFRSNARELKKIREQK